MLFSQYSHAAGRQHHTNLCRFVAALSAGGRQRLSGRGCQGLGLGAAPGGSGGAAAVDARWAVGRWIGASIGATHATHPTAPHLNAWAIADAAFCQLLQMDCAKPCAHAWLIAWLLAPGWLSAEAKALATAVAWAPPWLIA